MSLVGLALRGVGGLGFRIKRLSLLGLGVRA